MKKVNVLLVAIMLIAQIAMFVELSWAFDRIRDVEEVLGMTDIVMGTDD